MAYSILSANAARTQLNRDGTTSTATLGLCTTGIQGSDNVLYQSAPWTDWNGFCLSVLTSTDRPFSSATNWIVYPNNFPTQQVEIYYDLPTYTYPTEYHEDEQSNAQMTVVNSTGTMPTCTPALITTALQTSVLTYQFCYQAYAAAKGATQAWQVAIQGAFVTQSALTTSPSSNQPGLYILSVSGTRTQLLANGTQSVTPIAGQAFVRSGGGDGTELNADPYLIGSAPHITSGGTILYMATPFTFPDGTVPLDNSYARVNNDNLKASSGVVTEANGPAPDWSGMALSCSATPMTCPTIGSSASAAVDTVSSSSFPGTCGANSQVIEFCYILVCLLTWLQNSSFTIASISSSLLPCFCFVRPEGPRL